MKKEKYIIDEIQGYSVEKLLGEGRYSKVYLACRNDIKRAIKVIEFTDHLSTNEIGTGGRGCSYYNQLYKDLLEEVKIISELSREDNRYIVQYYEYEKKKIQNEDKETTYICIFMEYLKPLTNFVKTTELLFEDVVQIGKNIAQALMVCHENCILHRDIKPDNIFVSERDGRGRKYKIGDFGVSKKLEQGEMAKTLKGTPMYMAPEVFQGRSDERKYGYSSDIYSLGLVLYVLLNENRLPFFPDYPEEVLPNDETNAFMERMKGSVPKDPINAPKGIAEVIKKALLDEKNRYQTAGEFFKAWNAATEDLTEEEKKRVVLKKTEDLSEEKNTISYTQKGGSILNPKWESSPKVDSIENKSIESVEEKNTIQNGDNIDGGSVPNVISNNERTDSRIEPPVENSFSVRRKIVSFVIVISIVAALVAGSVRLELPMKLKSIFGKIELSNEIVRETETTVKVKTAEVLQEKQQNVDKMEETGEKQLEDTVEWKFEENILIQYLGLDSELVLPKGIEGIGEKVFADSLDLINVKIPRGTYFIGKGAFENCANLQIAELPESLKEIDQDAFAGCSKLGNITLANTIQKIGERAFCGCSSITEWNLPDQLIEIGDYAFMGNSQITEIIIPSYVEKIGDYAFQGCSKLQQIEIPESVVEIGEHTFSLCPKGLKIICKENSKAHEYALLNKISFEFQ